MEWIALDLFDCLKSLYGNSKLFQLKEKKDNKDVVSLCESYTVINSHLVYTKAPTKMEAYRIALVAILKEFYYFPFNDRMDLPVGTIGENTFIGNPFQKQFLYPEDFAWNNVRKFLLKEKAYGKICFVNLWNFLIQ